MARSEQLKEVKRHQAADRLRAKEQKARQLERMQAHRDLMGSADGVRNHNAIVTGLVPRITGAIDSWAGKRVPLTVTHPAARFYAATDFTTIRIDLPQQDDVDIDFAADLRGLAYHEAGHILKSVPFSDLLDGVMPLSDTWMVGDGHRRTFIEQVAGDTARVHKAWNLLEDQRMESAMVQESRNLGRYYNVIVLTHVLDQGVSDTAHLLLYGREHVESTVRASARQAFLDSYGEEMTLLAENTIATYKASKDLTEMWQCVVIMTRLIDSLPDDVPGSGSVDTHEEGGEPLGSNETSKRLVNGASQQDTTDDQADGEEDDAEDDESDDSEDGEDGEGENDGEGNSPDNIPVDRENPTDMSGEGPGGASSTGEPFTRQKVKDAADKAREARNIDQNAVNDVKAFNEAKRQADNSLPILRIAPGVDSDPVAMHQAIRLNQQVRNLLEQARAEAAPSWQDGQRSGVLDVRRYITRQPGDMEVFRSYAPGGDMALPNLSVSVILDGSQSMDLHSQALGVAAYAMKSACDAVGVPCTVTVFDTRAFLLWDENDRPLDIPLNTVPSGGTDPKAALDLIEAQRCGKDNHLVIIMTDGAWQGGWQGLNSMAHYAAPGRDIALFFYGFSENWGEPNVKGMETCSTVAKIDDLNDLPRYLNRYLVRSM